MRIKSISKVSSLCLWRPVLVEALLLWRPVPYAVVAWLVWRTAPSSDVLAVVMVIVVVAIGKSTTCWD